MSEIEKLYKNAGFIQKQCKDYSCTVCEQYKTCGKYPPFTAEKQLELIKEIYPGYPLYYAGGNYDNFSFEEGLAYRINNSWDDLMDIQRQQIKEILNESTSGNTSASRNRTIPI